MWAGSSCINHSSHLPPLSENGVSPPDGSSLQVALPLVWESGVDFSPGTMGKAGPASKRAGFRSCEDGRWFKKFDPIV